MDKKIQILLVEDEESLAIGLEFNLTAEGYEVTWVTDGKEALKRIHILTASSAFEKRTTMGFDNR